MLNKQSLHQIRHNIAEARQWEVSAQGMRDSSEKDSYMMAGQMMGLTSLFSLQVLLMVGFSFLAGYIFKSCENVWMVVPMMLSQLIATAMIFYANIAYQWLILTRCEYELFRNLYKFADELTSTGQVRMGTMSALRSSIETLDGML